MSRRIILAIIVVNLMASTGTQASFISRLQQSQSHQSLGWINKTNLARILQSPTYHIKAKNIVLPDPIILAGWRKRQEIRREIKRHFKRKERRERRKAVIGGVIIGAIVAGAVKDNRDNREYRREIIEHHHYHRDRRDYDYDY